MKKILLSLSLIAGAAISTHANSILFINMLPCTFNFGVNGVVGTDVFGGNNVMIPTGSTPFADPSQLPNVGYTGTAPLSSGTIKLIKGYPLVTEASFVIGEAPTYPTVFNSGAVGSFPVCNSGVSYTATWSQGTPGGNIVVLIF